MIIEKESIYDLKNEQFKEQVKEDLKEIFPNSILNTQYSLGYSQGDGVNIYGDLDYRDIVNYMIIHKKINLTKKEEKTLEEYRKNALGYMRIPENRRYGYCYIENFCIYSDWFDEYYRYKNLNTKLLKNFEKKIKETIMEICKEYEERGYKEIYE